MDLRERFWEVIQEKRLSDFWRIELLCSIPEDQISPLNLEQLYKTFRNLREGFSLWFKPYEKYLVLDSQVFKRLLQIVVKKIEVEGIRINVDHDFFEKYIVYVDDLALIKRAYLQQDNLGSHFDFNGTGLLGILEKDSNFLVDYLNNVFSEHGAKKAHDYKHLSIIWKMQNYQKMLDEGIQFMIEKESYYSFNEHFVNAFFQNLKDDESLKAEQYIMYMIDRFSSFPAKINLAFDIIYHSMKHLFDEAFKLYLSKNLDVNCFEKIEWVGKQGVYYGGVIIGDLKAAEWSKLLQIIEGEELGYKVVPIKRFVNDRILEAKRSADWERKRKFLS